MRIDENKRKKISKIFRKESAFYLSIIFQELLKIYFQDFDYFFGSLC